MTRTIFTIRPATADDADAVADMREVLVQQHEVYHILRFGAATDARMQCRKHFLDLLEKPSSIMLVACDGDDSPVAYLQGSLGEPQPVFRRLCRGEVDSLYVLPNYRRNGVGRAIMAEAERIMKSRGAAYVMLSVAAANQKALNFYESLGMRTMIIQLFKEL